MIQWYRIKTDDLVRGYGSCELELSQYEILSIIKIFVKDKRGNKNIGLKLLKLFLSSNNEAKDLLPTFSGLTDKSKEVKEIIGDFEGKKDDKRE